MSSTASFEYMQWPVSELGALAAEIPEVDTIGTLIGALKMSPVPPAIAHVGRGDLIGALLDLAQKSPDVPALLEVVSQLADDAVNWANFPVAGLGDYGAPPPLLEKLLKITDPEQTLGKFHDQMQRLEGAEALPSSMLKLEGIDGVMEACTRAAWQANPTWEWPWPWKAPEPVAEAEPDVSDKIDEAIGAETDGKFTLADGVELPAEIVDQMAELRNDAAHYAKVCGINARIEEADADVSVKDAALKEAKAKAKQLREHLERYIRDHRTGQQQLFDLAELDPPTDDDEPIEGGVAENQQPKGDGHPAPAVAALAETGWRGEGDEPESEPRQDSVDADDPDPWTKENWHRAPLGVLGFSDARIKNFAEADIFLMGDLVRWELKWRGGEGVKVKSVGQKAREKIGEQRRSWLDILGVEVDLVALVRQLAEEDAEAISEAAENPTVPVDSPESADGEAEERPTGPSGKPRALKKKPKDSGATATAEPASEPQTPPGMAGKPRLIHPKIYIEGEEVPAIETVACVGDTMVVDHNGKAQMLRPNEYDVLSTWPE